jgi:hypothetical protein
MMFLSAIGKGGGSITKFDSTHQSIEVGPERADSEPEPSRYDMGGREPTGRPPAILWVFSKNLAQHGFSPFDGAPNNKYNSIKRFLLEKKISNSFDAILFFQ